MLRKKHYQKVKALAVWNEEKRTWEVTIKQKFQAENCITGKLFTKHWTTKNIEISECDEFVIPWAILEDNGINTKVIDDCMKRED